VATASAPRRAVGIVLAAVEQLGRKRQIGHAFGPGAGLEAVENRLGNDGLDVASLIEVVEELGTHLDSHRRAGAFSVHDWKVVLGSGPGAGRPPRGADQVALRSGIEQSLGMLDAFALDESQRHAPWRRDAAVARRMLAYFGVAWLRLVRAGKLPEDDVARFGTRAVSRLTVRGLITADPSPTKVESTAATPAVDQDAPTAATDLDTGLVVGEGPWQLRVAGTVRASRARSGSCLYAVTRVSGPEAPRLVLKVPNLPRSTESPELSDLPASDFVMRPLARLLLDDGRTADVLPRAWVDVHAWWRTRREQGRQPLEGREVAALAAPMSAALVALHTGRGGVAPRVHGDVKLSQFLVGAPSGAAVQLTDLDLAVPALIHPDGVEAPTTVPALGHTLGYLPPDPDPNMTSRRRDVWALATCWHLLLADAHPAEVEAGRELTDVERFNAVRAGAWRISETLDRPWAELLELILTKRQRLPAEELLDAVLGLYETTSFGRRSVIGAVRVDANRWLVTEPGGDERVVTELVDHDGRLTS
jgi:hypothetical protein